MKILFDHGTPAPLRHEMTGHEVRTAYEMGWARLSNGELLEAAESAFEGFITTDQNLGYQQT
jgi:hypothetical protein